MGRHNTATAGELAKRSLVTPLATTTRPPVRSRSMSNTTGFSNTATGDRASFSNTTGNVNTATGA